MIKEELPEQLGFALALNNKALEQYAKMPKKKKKIIIDKSLELDNPRDMQRLVNRISSDQIK